MARGTLFVSSSDAVVRSIAVLICVGGCSFALSGPDPKRTATTAPKCDTSKGLVVADGVGSAATGLLGLAAGRDTALGVGLLLGSAAYAASALAGNSRVDHCRVAFQVYEGEMANAAAAERAPALARRPHDPYEAPASAALPPPIPRPAPMPEPAPKPVEPAAQTAKLDEADAFHVPVGASEPARPAQPKPNPAKPVSSDTWRDFWKGIP